MLQSEQRRLLIDFFTALDTDGSGCVSPEELAEPPANHFEAIVDVKTVIQVCGEKDLTADEFLEYMCEDGYRAHENSTHVYRDGQELRFAHRTSVYWKGWILADFTDPYDKASLSWADALQFDVEKLQKVLRQEKAEARAKAKEKAQGRRFGRSMAVKTMVSSERKKMEVPGWQAEKGAKPRSPRSPMSRGAVVRSPASSPRGGSPSPSRDGTSPERGSD